MDEAITSYLKLEPLEDLSYNDFLLKNRLVIVNELSGKPLQDQKSFVKKRFTAHAKQRIHDEQFKSRCRPGCARVNECALVPGRVPPLRHLHADKDLSYLCPLHSGRTPTGCARTAIKRQVDMCSADIFEKSTSCQGQEIVALYDSRKKPRIDEVEIGETLGFGTGRNKNDDDDVPDKCSKWIKLD
ncbi:hypothetical protein BC937DRAFT_86297 [Endogone sp. FLAS-F59071]|nr:hypothetical protein BC937DRAFT_86297 [Endogone sp. FLAS-F59071]|eukprot:RUS20136.1 hypothetical protein BC937DRAFT_86297 [Endogone sp. FLAS-F59071]